MPYAEKMLETKVANKRMKSKPDFNIPKLPKKKYPAQRIQDQKRLYHAAIGFGLPIPHPSQRYHTHPPLPSKARVGDRKPPSPAGTKFEDGSVQPGPDMPKRPKAKAPKKKAYKLQGEPINTPFVPNARPLTKSEKKARLKRLYGR
jgi:hypothetical protein